MGPVASTVSWLRALARWLAMSLLLGCVLGVLLSARRGVTLEDVVVSAAVSTLYSASTGLPVMVALRRLRPRLAARPPVTQWLVYIVVLFAIAAAGTLVAGLVLVGLGLWSLHGLWRNYFAGLQIAIAIAVPVSLAAGAFSRLRARLARTEASLHAKELDHQRALGLATEARLASLESRVRPHFLFNALNSAIALIPEDPGRAEQLLERLAGLLRFSLDAASAIVSLGEELRIVTDYLEIERVRFGDRLRYELDVPGALHGAMIPAFAVQTVVENSVKYAVSARKAGARIVVRARRDAGCLRLEISDDGPGFTGPIWLPGHGLDGLRARLDALYGSAARVVAPVALPGGTGAGVTIELPEAA
jgi:two-component system, LytTR family, sensor histidine kinase AlgZ